MKKLITTLLLTCSITPSFAVDFGDAKAIGSMVSTTASPVITTFNPIAGVLVYTTGHYFFAEMFENSPRYEGLDYDAVEVLANSIELEDSPALSMFKEDILENKEAIEAEFQANNIDLAVEELTDEEIAQIALASTVKQ